MRGHPHEPLGRSLPRCGVHSVWSRQPGVVDSVPSWPEAPSVTGRSIGGAPPSCCYLVPGRVGEDSGVPLDRGRKGGYSRGLPLATFGPALGLLIPAGATGSRLRASVGLTSREPIPARPEGGSADDAAGSRVAGQRLRSPRQAQRGLADLGDSATRSARAAVVILGRSDAYRSLALCLRQRGAAAVSGT